MIITIFCSPALAISSSDFIAQYKGQSVPTIPIPTLPVHTPTPSTTGDVNHFASLSVSSTPTRAMVFLDGSYRGLTPVTIHELSVGTHQLRVSRIGYEDYSTEIVIPACHRVWYYGTEAWVCSERQISIDVTLKKIESTPTLTPAPTPTLPRFIMSPIPTPTPLIPSGFVTPTQTPTPSNDGNEPLHGVEYISVNSKPPGADVYLSHLFSDLPDEYLGRTPILIREMPIKNPDYQGCDWVRITLTKTGYRNATFDWPLCDGSSPTFFITLTPAQTTSGSTDEDRYSFWFRRPNNNFLVF